MKTSTSLQPIVFQKDKGDTRVVVRSWSRRMSVIDLKTFRVMREIDLADHETALFFADKLTSNNYVKQTHTKYTVYSSNKRRLENQKS